jgi:hypothetical protein
VPWWTWPSRWSSLSSRLERGARWQGERCRSRRSPTPACPSGTQRMHGSRVVTTAPGIWRRLPPNSSRDAGVIECLDVSQTVAARRALSRRRLRSSTKRLAAITGVRTMSFCGADVITVCPWLAGVPSLPRLGQAGQVKHHAARPDRPNRPDDPAPNKEPTTPDSARPGATSSDSRGALTCGSPTQPGAARQHGGAWHAEVGARAYRPLPPLLAVGAPRPPDSLFSPATGISRAATTGQRAAIALCVESLRTQLSGCRPGRFRPPGRHDQRNGGRLARTWLPESLPRIFEAFKLTS